MLENTEGTIKNDNPEELTTQGTQDTGQINVREYRRDNKKGQSRETGNIGYTRHRTLENTEGTMKKDNPEKLATQGTQNTGQINVREYRRDNKKGQSRETGNIGYTRRRKTKQNTTQYVLDTTICKETQIT